METNARVAIVGIVVENPDAAEEVNRVLHAYGAYIIGRMGLPYPKKGVNVISVILDAPADAINALSGKLGMTKGIAVKTLLSNV